MTAQQYDPLQWLLDQQSELQRKMPSPHPTNLYLDAFPKYNDADDGDRKPAIDFAHWNVTALTDELHEMLGEMGWKPWAKSRHINLEAARGEVIDALHFLLNLCLVLGLNNSKEIIERYAKKHEKNAKRQEEGYDGLSTKCPGCKRALDDDGVACYIAENEEDKKLRISFPHTPDTTKFVMCTKGGVYMLKDQK